jgi:hypothetical protein
MNKIISIVLFLILPLGCNAENAPGRIDLAYGGYVFSIPKNIVVVADAGGDDNILIFRYGQEKGKRYLAFTEMGKDKNLKFGCKPVEFFDSAFSKKEGTECDNAQVLAFKKMFVQGRDVGEWAGNKTTVYYSIGKKQSFLFLFDKSDNAIKIDTDFLNKSEFKNIVSNALN